eukprot:2821770-Amphidinium_carterae.1
MCIEAEWGDTGLVKDMSAGFPLVCDLRCAGQFQSRMRPAQIDEAQLRGQSAYGFGDLELGAVRVLGMTILTVNCGRRWKRISRMAGLLVRSSPSRMYRMRLV